MVKPVSLNALLPILVTPSGMVNVPLKPVPLKASASIEVTEFGIVKVPVKPLKPILGITSTPFPIFKVEI